MIQEPETLYKLMVLYMLKEVNFPLTNSQLSQFFLDKEYTTYFTLQQVLSELIDSKLIADRRSGNSTRYEITSDGLETLGFFGNDIGAAAIADMDQYLSENKFRLRSEAGTTADFYKEGPENFILSISQFHTYIQRISCSKIFMPHYFLQNFPIFVLIIQIKTSLWLNIFCISAVIWDSLSFQIFDSIPYCSD